MGPRFGVAIPVELKAWWLQALADADTFVRRRPPAEAGCLYYDTVLKTFVAPKVDEEVGDGRRIVLHFGRPGGVLPRL